jgi:tetrahydromethanopterin S-methyltransferase subunit G
MVSDISERNGRISALEANVDGVNRRLDRIEGKIDYLIQGKAK